MASGASCQPRQSNRCAASGITYRSRTRVQDKLRRPISSQATLGGAPRFGRVTQPGLRKRTPPIVSSRGTCVCPCKNTSQSVGNFRRGSGTCCKRKRLPCLVRSMLSGHSKLLSQFPRTNVTGGPSRFSSSRIAGLQRSPRCQISLASRAKSRTISGSLLCVSAITRTRWALVSFIMSSETVYPPRRETSLILRSS
jgi:hypothetical protein